MSSSLLERVEKRASGFFLYPKLVVVVALEEGIKGVAIPGESRAYLETRISRVSSIHPRDTSSVE